MNPISATILFFGCLLCLPDFSALSYAQDAQAAPDSLQTSQPRPDSTSNAQDSAHIFVRSIVAGEDTHPGGIGAKEFEGIIAEDIVDYVQLTPVVSNLDYGSLGQVSPFSFRGATPQWSRVYVDGMVVQNPLTGFVDTNNLPFNLVEQVTFDPAEEAILIKLREFDDPRPYSRVQFRAGDWDYSDIGISFGLPVRQGTRFLFTGGRREYGGYFLVTPDRVVDEGRSATHARYLTRLTHRPSDKFNFMLLAKLDNIKNALPAALVPDLVPGGLDGRREAGRWDLYAAVQQGNLTTTGARWQGSAQIARVRAKSLTDTLLFDNQARVYNLTMGYDYRLPDSKLAFQMTFSRSDFSAIDRADNMGEFSTSYTSQVSSKLGVHATMTADVFNPAGADTIEVSRSVRLQPKFRIAYEPADDLRLWLTAWRNSRYPTFAERFWPAAAYLGKPDLEPETRSAAELGINYRSQRVDFSTVLFADVISNWIGNTIRPDNASFGPEHLGTRSGTGLELSYKWDYAANGKAGLVANYLFIKEDTPAKKPFVPEYAVHTYLEYGKPWFQDYVFLRVRLTGRLYGKRSGWVYPVDGTLPQLLSVSPDALWDGKASLIFTDVALTFSLENIADRPYQLVPGLYMPPRTFRFSVDWQFWD